MTDVGSGVAEVAVAIVEMLGVSPMCPPVTRCERDEYFNEAVPLTVTEVPSPPSATFQKMETVSSDASAVLFLTRSDHPDGVVCVSAPADLMMSTRMSPAAILDGRTQALFVAADEPAVVVARPASTGAATSRS